MHVIRRRAKIHLHKTQLRLFVYVTSAFNTFECSWRKYFSKCKRNILTRNSRNGKEQILPGLFLSLSVGFFDFLSLSAFPHAKARRSKCCRYKTSCCPFHPPWTAQKRLNYFPDIKNFLRAETWICLACWELEEHHTSHKFPESPSVENLAK